MKGDTSGEAEQYTKGKSVGFRDDVQQVGGSGKRGQVKKSRYGVKAGMGQRNVWD